MDGSSRKRRELRESVKEVHGLKENEPNTTEVFRFAGCANARVTRVEGAKTDTERDSRCFGARF